MYVHWRNTGLVYTGLWRLGGGHAGPRLFLPHTPPGFPFFFYGTLLLYKKDH
jgi:hypothetical protein